MLNIAHACVTEGVNGPGRRFTVWVQGCGRRCRGCFNPGLQPREHRRRLMPEDLVEEARASADIEGVTLSGGEPFDQAGDLAVFLDALRSGAGPDEMTVIAFTGYLLEELRGGSEARRQLLGLVDLLVDGPFREEEYCELPLRGSRNQRLIPLTQAGQSLLGRVTSDGRHGFEVTITPEGDVLVAGFPPRESRSRLTGFPPLEGNGVG